MKIPRDEMVTDILPVGANHLFSWCFSLILSSRFLATFSALLSSHAERPLDFRLIAGVFSSPGVSCSYPVSVDTSTPDTRMSPGSWSPRSSSRDSALMLATPWDIWTGFFLLFRRSSRARASSARDHRPPSSSPYVRLNRSIAPDLRNS